jgi:hypothetical protein
MAAIKYKICVYSYNCKEISSMWLGYLYCFIGGFSCQGICTYTRRIHWLFLLLSLGFFKCFNILYWKRMHKIVLKMTQYHENLAILNFFASETKANESFDWEAKRTRSTVGKFISKRSEHVYIKEFKNRSKANTFDSSKICFEAKRTCFC